MSNANPTATEQELRDAEPQAGSGSVPGWLVIVAGVLFYIATTFVDQNGGEFHPMVYKPGENLAMVKARQPKSDGDEVFAEGAKVYSLYCVACHQATGTGAAGQFPPLAGSEWVQSEGPNRMIRIVLNGLIGPIEVKGAQFNNNMLAWRDVLNDQQIAAVLTFVRGNKDWGNSSSKVTPDVVKKIREETAGRGNYWTSEELKATSVN